MLSNQLERILARPPLVSSPSLSRLLRFIVEETIAGRAPEISEYNLGVRVFNRGADFNPRTDPIVRVQTHHLRSRLTQYYAKAGAGDPIVIELPARTYVPMFRENEQLAPTAELAITPAGESESPPVPQVAAAQLASAQPAAAEPTPDRRTRGLIAMGAILALVLLAAFGLLGRSWQVEGHSQHHDPEPVAQDLYIRGRYLLDRQSEASLRQSIECFRQSTARDPQFAAAFAGLADAHDLLVQYGFMSPKEGMEIARHAARHALDLDPNLAEGYVSLAAISEAYDWNFNEAESQYKHAIRLNPELPAGHLWYGMFLRDQNRLPEAMHELRRAEQLEPLSVLASINLAGAFRMAGDSDSALERAKRAIELNPGLPSVEVLLANIYRSRSNIAEADATLVRAEAMSAGNPHALSILACAYARLGRRAESVNLLHELEQLSAQRYVSPYDMGNVALMLGDEDRAVTWYEEAYRQRSTGIVFLRNDKADSYKSWPRLRSLIQKMGNG